MSELCEKTGADVNEVKSNRYGHVDWMLVLKASVGLEALSQKDILNLVYIAKSYGLQEVAGSRLQNDHQKRRFSIKIVQTLYNTVPIKRLLSGWQKDN
jgi:UDPglucose 6-dehydrogenase